MNADVVNDGDVNGRVVLVGAGPGDPDLITVRGARALAGADAVVFDRLAPPALLDLAPASAERIYAGKEPGRAAPSQDRISALLVERARAGAVVVRLKGGDPFVFGRGGEEALALRAAGIPFEVVPGVSSATAAPALAGIPVTHRGACAGFAVIAGHTAESYLPVIDGLRPGGLTLVLLMAVASRQAIARALIERSWPPGTPAALVFGASHDGGSAWTGTLLALARGDGGQEGDHAGTLVIGDVVNLRPAIAGLAVAESAEAMR